MFPLRLFPNTFQLWYIIKDSVKRLQQQLQNFICFTFSCKADINILLFIEHSIQDIENFLVWPCISYSQMFFPDNEACGLAIGNQVFYAPLFFNKCNPDGQRSGIGLSHPGQTVPQGRTIFGDKNTIVIAVVKRYQQENGFLRLVQQTFFCLYGLGQLIDFQKQIGALATVLLFDGIESRKELFWQWTYHGMPMLRH